MQQKAASVTKVIVTFVSSMANENKKRNYYERLQELNGSIKDASFSEKSDIPLENNLPRDFL